MTKNDARPTCMTLGEVAERLSLGRSKLYELARGGITPLSKAAGRWRLLRPEVGEWMLRQCPGSSNQSEDHS